MYYNNQFEGGDDYYDAMGMPLIQGGSGNNSNADFNSSVPPIQSQRLALAQALTYPGGGGAQDLPW